MTRMTQIEAGIPIANSKPGEEAIWRRRHSRAAQGYFPTGVAGGEERSFWKPGVMRVDGGCETMKHAAI